MRQRLFAVVLLVAMSAAGCASSASKSDEDPDSAFQAAIEENNNSRYDLEDEVVRCMAEAGYEYTPPMEELEALAESPIPLSETALFTGDREGWLDDGYGYVTVILKGTLAYETVGPDHDSEQGEGYMAALYGDGESDQGCYGDAAAGSETIEQVEDLLAKRVDAEQRVISTLQGTTELSDWQRCMADHGLLVNSVGDPARLVADAAWESLAEWSGESTGESGVAEPAEGAMPDAPPPLDLVFDNVSGRYVSGTDQDFVDRLYDAEIEIASIDYECSAELYPLAKQLLDQELG